MVAFVLGCLGWSTGCATAPPPLVDAAFATGQYAPARIAVLPPDVFVVLDQAGDNDPVRSAALGQAVSEQTVRAVEQSLRARGYDVDLSARWDGIVGPDGSLLVTRDELGWLANGVLQFGNMRAGENAPTGAPYVAPQLAAKVGWATQSDALLYVNVKGVATTSGKRAASVIAAVFIVVIVAAIVVAVALNGRGGGGGPGHSGGWSGGGASSVPRSSAVSGFRGASPVAGGHAAAMPSGGFHGTPSGGAAAAMPSGGFHGAPGGAAGAMPSGNAMARPGGAAASMPSGNAAAGATARPGGAAAGMPSGNAAGALPSGSAVSRSAPATGGWQARPPAGGGWQGAPASGGWRGGAAPAAGAPTGRWRGGGGPPPPPPGAYVYSGGPRVGFGVGVVVPLDGPVYTHDGDVQHEDEIFAGDELYVSMTLVSSSDGRVLWHERQELDLDADDPQDVGRMVEAFVGSLPPRGGFTAPPSKH
ncbi:MAG TPA: hypothetical protein VHL80_06025 [Polyangia bacterium]|nr:hypothetical protein [Polyangia bacterium]